MIQPVKLGLAGGILWGLGMVLCTCLSLWTGYATQFLMLMADIYPGYTISFEGIAIGLVYGFLDAFIGLVLFGWLYNKLQNGNRSL